MKMKINLIFVLFVANFLFCCAASENPCENGQGRCVHVNNCRENYGHFQNDQVSLSETMGECHYLEKCCKLSKLISDDEIQAKIIEGTKKDKLERCIQQCHATNSLFPENGNQPSRTGKSNLVEWKCGYSNKNGIGISVPQETDVAQFGEFPWHLALIRVENDEESYLCGASLINPRVALTGAHCVHNHDKNQLVVRAGEWDTQTTNEPFPHVDKKVEKVIVHQGFDKSNLHNNIALLLLDSPLDLAVHINTICLPSEKMKFDENSECYATGWGADNFFLRDFYRVNLKKVKLPIVAKPKCQNMLRSTKLGRNFKLDSSFMCAGGEENMDTCIGDGGSPLVCKLSKNNDQFVQVGIVSWGISCGLKHVPGVYTDVLKFTKWIDDQMNNDLNEDTDSYSLLYST